MIWLNLLLLEKMLEKKEILVEKRSREKEQLTKNRLTTKPLRITILSGCLPLSCSQMSTST